MQSQYDLQAFEYPRVYIASHPKNDQVPIVDRADHQNNQR